MQTKNAIRAAYIAYSIYLLLLILLTTIHIKDMVFSFLAMWLCYYIFVLGIKSKYCHSIDNSCNNDLKLTDLKSHSVIYFIFTSLLFAIITAKFYTGQSPRELISNLKNNQSVYYIYQANLKARDIGRSIASRINRLPYILMLFVVKFNMIAELVKYSLINREHNEIIKVFIALISYLYICLARGTSYEIFELLILLVFIYYQRIDKNRVAKKNLGFLWIAFLGIGAFILFTNRILQRGVMPVFEIDGFIFNNDNFMNNVFPTFPISLYFTYNYFGFGMIYFNKMITQMISEHILYTCLVPKGSFLITGQNLKAYMEPIISINARWVPDIANIISNYGIVITLLIIFYLGKLSNKYSSFYNNRSIRSYYIMNYFIFLQMISFPVGNFVVTSSSNLLILLFIILKEKIKVMPVRDKRYKIDSLNVEANMNA